jgi:beta-glucan synthesis-associated protein KRE6
MDLGREANLTFHTQWPYTYDSCDIGTVANQSIGGLPEAALTGGDKYADGVLSYLPGQRLSRCTCPGESHPGPIHSDGTYVGRGAPEIDVFEAQVKLISVSVVVVVLLSDMCVKITGRPLTGQVSQSGQWAVRQFHSLHHPNVLKIAALAL